MSFGLLIQVGDPSLFVSSLILSLFNVGFVNESLYDHFSYCMIYPVYSIPVPFLYTNILYLYYIAHIP